MKLELKHLAPYLPYKLKIQYWDRNVVMNAGQGSSMNWIGITAVLRRQGEKQNCYPILRPLSDLTKEIKVDGSLINPENELCKKLLISNCKLSTDHNIVSLQLPKGVSNRLIAIGSEIVDECDFGVYQKLLEWHFDVFGLIEKGLAIDINTLKP